MAENNGVFSDLFNAVGAPIQNVADFAGSGITSALSVAESCTNLCATALTSSINTGVQLIQGVASAISTVLTPKK
ncbi:MAG: hypothetical protein HGB35_04630 [Geobacteraceae bacterium]|nr:hypothetical protein [Geobacteraceae bacterium]